MLRGRASHLRSTVVIACMAMTLVIPTFARVADARSKADVSDFNGDGISDLAIAAPGESIAGVAHAGLVETVSSSDAGPAATTSRSWDRGSEGVEGGPHVDASLGASLASGDFNGDDYDDLAVGASGDTVGGHTGAGSVTVIGGSKKGLGGSDDRLITQNSSGVEGDAEGGDHFGTALAVADFNGDGYDDLAIGAPDEDVNGKQDAGTVTVVYGSRSGLHGTGSRLLMQGVDGLFGKIESGDHFGRALAAGNADGDTYSDLAIGVPNETIGTKKQAGAIDVLLGTSTGITPSAEEPFSQGIEGVPGAAESGDHFGEALAMGDVNEDGDDDVLVGAPGESVGSAIGAGAVTILYGTDGGVRSKDAHVISQATNGVPSAAEAGDRFGAAIATGDVNGDGDDEVLVGAPGEGAGSIAHAGSATLLWGTHDGVTTSGAKLLYEGHNGVPGKPGTDELFGSAVRVVDLNDDGRAEVIAGAPGELIGSHKGGGDIAYLFATRDGLSSAGHTLSQNSAAVAGSSETGDLFGFALS